MKQRLFFLLSLATFWVGVFILGKLGFLLYNLGIEPFTLTDFFQVVAHGFSMDLSTTGYLIALPWLCVLVGLWWKGLPLRRFLLPYHIIIGILVAAIVVGDIVLYEYWKFKIDSTIFIYLHNTEGTANSIYLPLLLLRLLGFVVVAAALPWAAWRLTPQCMPASGRRVLHSLLWVLVGGLIFLGIRGGVQESTMNVGVAYYSPRLYLNHAAVNPAFSLIASSLKNKDFPKQFDLLPEDEREAVFQGMYPPTNGALTDTLLNQQRPNLLIVIMESYGSQFIREMGGMPDVAPQFSRLIPEGIFWENMYSNSFRTDRGIVCTLSGWISYPSLSLMRIPGRPALLPSLARSYKRAGYSTHYLYGGDIDVMSKKGYLVATGYEHITSSTAFSIAEVNESKWGANDHVTAQRTFEILKQKPADRPWHMVLQTLSSHEPYDVPYSRLKEKVPNAFAFTDEVLGTLIDSLKTLPSWKNTLVVLLPDHGSTYERSYQEPEYFHSPMLWLGGAVKQPRRMSVLMNQSDMAATLLAQMGLPHDDFPWSRNVLAADYTYPFAYCSFPSGILFRDSTGVTLFDTNSLLPITEQPAPNPERIRRAKAILQTSYDLLGTRR